ncbi:hypothetical protein [Sulfobacillus sp. hq2]|uniref:hypothetical protein n=1 Tax=Sulfobacillus TaxID=28033 RepID=UPI0011AF3E34|nr:hypothetical protein [Sulfobacillus sp. hq2]
MLICDCCGQATSGLGQSFSWCSHFPNLSRWKTVKISSVNGHWRLDALLCRRCVRRIRAEIVHSDSSWHTPAVANHPL